jgi:tetratricopeptide (TPR) repeat protein
LTSRSPDYRCYGIVGSEEVTGLDAKDAVQLLLKASAIREALWSINMADAYKVVNTLNRHALAITQAGAFIKRKFCTLKEYPERFRQHLSPRQAQSTYQNVYATFDVSATFLAKSGLEKHVRALQLLNILGFMHLSQVSESIFTRATKHISKVLADNRDGEDFAQLYSWHIERAPSAILPKATLDGLDTFAFREARDTLASLSLVKVSDPEHEMSMHPLIHVWVRDRMQDNPAALKAEWEKAAVILALSTEESGSYKDYFPSLIVQITACLEACPTEVMTTPPFNTGYAHLFYRLGYTQIFSSVSRNVRDTLFGYINNFALSERNVVRCKRILGSCLLDEDNDVLAAAMLEVVVRFESSVLSDDNCDKLNTQHELARALLRVGETAQAIELLEKVVQIRISTQPKDHRDRLASQYQLARALTEVGKSTRAVGLLEEVVQIEGLKLPEDHPDRLSSQYELALALMKVGENTRAIRLLEEVVRVEILKLPEDHHNRLVSQHELARALMNIGESTQAVRLLEEVVRIESLKLPEDDPDRLASRFELARALINIGQRRRLRQAIGLLEEVVRIESLRLPEDHHNRLASQRQLARALINIGESTRAVGLLEEVVRIEGLNLPENHRDRLASEYELARALMKVGENTRALRLLEEVVRIEGSKLPEDHRDRIASQRLLAQAAARHAGLCVDD